MFDRQPSDLALAIRDNTTPFVITGIQNFNTDIEIPIQVYLDLNREVIFSVDSQVGLDGQIIFLKDNVTGEYFEIQNTPKVMSLPAGTYLDRFSITFQQESTLSNDEFNLEGQVRIFHNSNSNEIILSSSQINLIDVEVYNIVGQTILNYKNTNNLNEIRLSTDRLKSAVYIIKARTENGAINKKIVVD